MAYHHGDAREALVRSAGEMLEDVGATALSLRSVAERAGLSRQAPYNHFTDKEAMLAALVETGFQRLVVKLQAAADAKLGGHALAAAGEAYIAFAQDQPALYRLMFSRELVDVAKFPQVAAASAEAFSVLVSVVETLGPPARVETASLAAWCMVHGYSTLCNETGLETPAHAELRAWQFAYILLASMTVAPNEVAGDSEGLGR